MALCDTAARAPAGKPPVGCGAARRRSIPSRAVAAVLFAAAALSGAAAQATAATAATAAASAGVCYLDKEGTGARATNVCDTAAVHNAGRRFTFILLATFGACLISCTVLSVRQEATTSAVFVHDAAALRERADAAAPGSAERAALEAQADDVEAAAADWSRLHADEMALQNSNMLPPRTSPQDRRNQYNRAYTTQAGVAQYLAKQKAQVANERSALLQRHGEHAFDGAREAQSAGARFALLLVVAIVLLGVPLAYYESITPCDAPLYQLCFSASTPTYACALDDTGSTCVATPI